MTKSLFLSESDLIMHEEKEAIPAFHSSKFLRLSQKCDKCTFKLLVNLQ